ncbi:MAG: DNA-3-methyladenine glycosylase 2 family protein [Solirubrobacterales bacterium]|nr:DNA-3-methyladenine glycosylase 2 family protein [Solirubrobacterales bacterium]
MLEVRREVRPPWPYRLPSGGGMDGILRVRGGVLQRLVHVGDEPAVVRVAQTAADAVLFGAQARHRATAEEAIARMRFALGVDDDLAAFYAEFHDDPWIGPSVRARPWLRVSRRPDPFEALAWAICEQLIEYVRAAAIERRIVVRLGRRCPRTGLRDLPAAERLAGTAPALLQSFDLAAGRALALTRAAREVASGRADLRAADHERAWARLRRIPGIGSWTIAVLALHGQGRFDVVPAGDLAYLKLLGRMRAGGNPAARATEEEVLEAFAPYGAWRGLAAAHALGTKATGAATRFAWSGSRPPVRSPAPARTRSSARWGSAPA